MNTQTKQSTPKDYAIPIIELVKNKKPGFITEVKNLLERIGQEQYDKGYNAKDTLTGLSKMYSIEDIKDAVCAVTGVSDEQLNGVSRKREFVNARRLYGYTCAKHTRCSLTCIGEQVGRRSTLR